MMHYSTQRGSAFFIILIAIFMFAALSYAVFKGGSDGTAALSSDQARLAAQEIISFSDTIAKTVQTLKLRGCTNEQINFSNNGGLSKSVDGTPFTYTNISSPPDGSCDVFSMNGGKAVAKLMGSQGVIPTTGLGGSLMHPQSFLARQTRVLGHGIDSGPEGTDVTLLVGRLKKETCVKTNDLLGISNPGGNPPFDVSNCGGTFTGSFVNCADPLGEDEVGLVGKSAFCVDLTNDGKSYIFFRVLIAR